MPQDIKIELNNLVKEIYDVFDISSIYLFGSYAYGTPNEDSDLDICIITDNKSKRKVEIMKLVRKAMAKVQSMPVDLLVYYSDEFNERAKLDCTLESQIFHEGVKLYG
ncbi:nucleotidyltransferase domain-containing protein [Clostridium sp. YIM B02505]|uniref:Nucleotidyltransferase domain-containing protein n=1 Tax=Clostridium yunnanense TaxID=2800325 RepID=A0ABS1EN60_9CLOT|nr:nucleotidyltransferase domain-containing protein [Clostridium yunnanense]MBK1810775.1 nucleotidyltransferase domain-containing protein [Clostridium yunnanense]